MHGGQGLAVGLAAVPCTSWGSPQLWSDRDFQLLQTWWSVAAIVMYDNDDPRSTFGRSTNDSMPNMENGEPKAVCNNKGQSAYFDTSRRKIEESCFILYLTAAVRLRVRVLIFF